MDTGTTYTHHLPSQPPRELSGFWAFFGGRLSPVPSGHLSQILSQRLSVSFGQLVSKNLLLCFLLLIAFAQQPVRAQLQMGQWRTHLPYQYARLAEVTSDRIYCSTTGGLFYYHLEDNSVETLSKVDGLSDVGIAMMRWSDELETLIIAYENANLDIIRDGSILNMPDIMQKQIAGDKSVNDICFVGSRVFLSMGFGIVEVDLVKEEVSETYYIGDMGEALAVNQVCSDGTWLYAATDEGVRRGLLSDPFLVDYNVWELETGLADPLGSYSGVVNFKGTLFAAWSDPAGIQDRIYMKEGDTWSSYPYFQGSSCLEMLQHGSVMTLVSDSLVSLISESLLVIEEMVTNKPQSASVDALGKLWVASYGSGLVHENDNGELAYIKPDGPSGTATFALESRDGRLRMVPGAVNGSWQNQWLTAQLQTFEGNRWSKQTQWDERDLITLAIDPLDPERVFAGSWGYGLFEFGPEETVRYTEENSSLQSFREGDYIRIGGVAFDPDGNLWMTNTSVENPISVRKVDGSWQSFRCDNLISSYNALGDILFSQSGHVWVIVPRGNGLFAMDPNFTPDEPADDLYKKVSVVDRFGKVITNDVHSFAEDRNGNIWLGTNQGVLVLYSPYRIFTEDFLSAQEVLIPRNDGSGLADVLLGTQVVTAIAVDGANRKWLGTAGGGIYLVSEDGTDEVHRFNTGNSPLLSDNITDIAIDGSTGEVFIGTDRGLISFMGDAHAGSLVYDNVIVYPNPVREDYEGPVAIKGLVEKSNVKITDMSGNLVYETTSLGGQAIWDGRNFRGQRVATGVYLVYLSSPDGNYSHVTKLLFIH